MYVLPPSKKLLESTMSFRIERDSMGEVQVPEDALYGAQTQRAADNFPISGVRFSRRFIEAVGAVKRAAAVANHSLGLLDENKRDAIDQAADEVIEGRHDDQFVLDIFQTGSGTSTNMNANEVIASRASDILGSGRGNRSVHPNRSEERRVGKGCRSRRWLESR